MSKVDAEILTKGQVVAAIIPAFKVKKQIMEVISSIGPEVHKIIIVDDKCPEQCGRFIEETSKDPRVEVVFHNVNLGVGGAVKTGYKRALEIEADIIIKVDGDGQMDTSRIEELICALRNGQANYTKGNRFFNVDAVKSMPPIRIFGNLGLTFLTKLSSGYWRIFDPNNGFTAITRNQLLLLPLDKIDNRYFFESDMLFRLNLSGATIQDVDMPAIYADEESNLRIRRVFIEFPYKHVRNFAKRIIYSYYLRDFNLASIELPLGILLSSFGLLLGAYSWIHGLVTSTATQTGTLILIAMSVLAGLQLVLAFFSYDTNKS
jgi:dolichol-phosphate mannosyltransferase